MSERELQPATWQLRYPLPNGGWSEWQNVVQHWDGSRNPLLEYRPLYAAIPAPAQAPPEDRCVEGRENLLLIAHEIREAKKAYLDGFGQVGNAARKEKLSQVLHDDATTIADALEAFAVSSTHSAPGGAVAGTERGPTEKTEGGQR